MVDKDYPVKASKVEDWELHEVLRDASDKDLPKDVIIRSEKTGISIKIPREDFKELVRGYYRRKGYDLD
jgi:hypothetical protein